MASRALIARAVIDNGRAIKTPYRFAFSPISTRRRMASERPGESSCLAAHLSTAVRNSSDSLIAVTGSRPVAGRPPLFGFGTTDLDLAMFWYYHKSKPRGSVNFRPGSNPQT
jgi:hypothetical protein